MYDETIQRSARRQRIQPIEFEHPTQKEIVNCFNQATPDPVSVILTGTAGMGKRTCAGRFGRRSKVTMKLGHPTTLI